MVDVFWRAGSLKDLFYTMKFASSASTIVSLSCLSVHNLPNSIHNCHYVIISQLLVRNPREMPARNFDSSYD